MKMHGHFIIFMKDRVATVHPELKIQDNSKTSSVCMESLVCMQERKGKGRCQDLMWSPKKLASCIHVIYFVLLFGCL